MANSKISALPSASTPLAGTEVLPVVQGGITEQVSVSDLTAGRAVSASSLALTTALPVTSGGTGTTTAFTAGSVVFAGTSGTYSQNNTNFFWDDTNNRLGLGSATPAVRLQVTGTSTTAIARIASTSAGTPSFTGAGAGLEITAAGMNEAANTYTPAIKFGSTDADFTTTSPKFGAAILAKAAQTYSSDTTGGMDLLFYTAPINPGTGNGLLERARLWSSGGWSIGNTTDPGATNLSVTGTVQSGNILLNTNTISTTDTNGNLTLAPNGTGYVALGGATPRILLTDTSTYTAQMRTLSGNAIFGSTNNTPVLLQANGSTRLTLNSADSDVKLEAGNLIQGTAAKGINFTANTPLAGKTSTLLNWYEEGTWTPNQGAGLTLVGAFSSTGRYTRIGRQVSIGGTVTGATSVAVTAAGVITSNLPFTVVTAGHGGATNVANNASATVICTSTSVTAASAIAATATITFSATYFV